MTVPVLGILFSFYKNKLFLLFITFSSQMLGIISISLQKFFKEPRPHLECTPDFYTQYGFPSNEIVVVTNTAISILMYTIYDKWKKKQKANKPKRKLTGKRVLKILAVIINTITVLFFSIGYPFIIYCFYLCTLRQAVLSLIFSMVSTVIFCTLAIGMLRKIK